MKMNRVVSQTNRGNCMVRCYVITIITDMYLDS